MASAAAGWILGLLYLRIAARPSIFAFYPTQIASCSFLLQPLLQQASFSVAGDASGAVERTCRLLRHAPVDVQL